MSKRRPKLHIEALTPELWTEFTTLFGARGACGGCWCMTPRLTRTEYERHKGAGNRRKMKRLVDRGICPGILGFRGDEAIGWCAIEPRTEFSSLARSRILAPGDNRPVWSIVCLFVAKPHREQGVSVALIEGAVLHARQHGARCIEAYPVEPKKRPMPPVFAYPGLASAYRQARFKEVARRSETRPIMRRMVRPK